MRRLSYRFADSANNGPVGTALVDELIPQLEKKYRGSGARFNSDT